MRLGWARRQPAPTHLRSFRHKPSAHRVHSRQCRLGNRRPRHRDHADIVLLAKGLRRPRLLRMRSLRSRSSFGHALDAKQLPIRIPEPLLRRPTRSVRRSPCISRKRGHGRLDVFDHAQAAPRLPSAAVLRSGRAACGRRWPALPLPSASMRSARQVAWASPRPSSRRFSRPAQIAGIGARLRRAADGPHQQRHQHARP